MVRWKARLKNWVLDSHERAVHVVRYEDLQRDVPREVAKMLNFLKIPFNKEELPIRLDGDFTKFKRKHTNDNFEHFSGNQTEFIKKELVDTIKLTQLANKSHVIQVEDYLP
jgi:iron only hydrogenase large subunit-like protein